MHSLSTIKSRSLGKLAKKAIFEAVYNNILYEGKDGLDPAYPENIAIPRSEEDTMKELGIAGGIAAKIGIVVKLLNDSATQMANTSYGMKNTISMLVNDSVYDLLKEVESIDPEMMPEVSKIYESKEEYLKELSVTEPTQMNVFSTIYKLRYGGESGEAIESALYDFARSQGVNLSNMCTSADAM